jgi:hypothetical protein
MFIKYHIRINKLMINYGFLCAVSLTQIPTLLLFLHNFSSNHFKLKLIVVFYWKAEELKEKKHVELIHELNH